MTLSFRERPMDAGDGRALADAMRAEIASMYEGLDLDGDHMPAAGPAQLSPPNGAFLVGYDGSGKAVCCGGVKRLDGHACEIKRMYVVPDARGRGVARALLGALEDAARARGYTVARLDTGPRQPGARGLYESAGYFAVANFNGNPVASFWGEKRLR
ncbi:MAG: GNAT family N-acetyltransferase [Solirubrobacteraceae bacterium]